ncbi:peptidyl-prolyl cis-trans isomerase [Aureococcus anophagefferens]|nr:peptidyl-prolyl cis-trans isomerase [Aureococcus anophagefferens]
MGRNQHSKDRMFVTATEHARDGGGYKKKREGKLEGSLPFECCALSLLPFESPCCARDGASSTLQLLPSRSGQVARDGRVLKVKDVLRLRMAKNGDGHWHCPVTCKAFNNFTKVVAAATTGNAFSYEAVRELCLKRGQLADLLDGTPFAKADLVMIHDPEDAALCARRDLANFAHLREEREAREARLATSRPEDHIRTSDSSRAVLDEAKRNVAAAEEARSAKEAANRAAKGFQADVRRDVRVLHAERCPSRRPQAPDATEDELKTARWKRLRGLGKKGYAQLRTSHGNLNVEIHADMVPRAAENFLGLCAKGYYDGSPFHRVVRHFFYVTLKSATHLDNKHTVFGKVVGGHDTLTRIENVPVDDADDHRPRTTDDPGATVFVDPTAEADAAFEAERTRPHGGSVGRYLPKRAAEGGDLPDATAPTKKKKPKPMSNFDGW